MTSSSSRGSSPRSAGAPTPPSCSTPRTGSGSRRSSPWAPCLPTCRTLARSRCRRHPTTRTPRPGSGPSRAATRGPTGIVGVLTEAASRAGLQTLSCWAAVPHYAGGAPSPKATLALLSTLERILDVSIPQAERRRRRPGLGARRQRARRVRRGSGRVRQVARAGHRCRGAARGQRRRDRPGVRALPASPPGRTLNLSSQSAGRLEPHPEQRVDRPREQPGCARRLPAVLEAPARPRIHGGERRWRVEVLAQRLADGLHGLVGIGPGVDRDRRPPGGEPLTSTRTARRRSSPTPGGSDGRAAPAGWPSGRHPGGAGRTPGRGCPADLLIFAPSRPTIAWCT